MSRSQRQNQKYVDFSGGYQNFTSPLLLKSNESPLCINVDISRSGILSKAKGFGVLTSSATPLGTPRGIYVWNKEDGANEIYTAFGSHLYKIVNNQFQEIGFIGNGTEKIEFAKVYIDTSTEGIEGVFEERLYMACGFSQELSYTTGSNVKTVTGVYAQHIAEYKGRIYLGNVKKGTKVSPTRVLFSEVSSDSFLDENFIDDLGEAVVALKEYKNYLFVMGQNKMASYDNYALRILTTDGGTTNSETVQITNERMLRYNRAGVFMVGNGTDIVSRPVEDWLNRINTQHDVTAYIDNKGRYCLLIGDITRDGIAYSNVILRYDVLMNSWDILTGRPYLYGSRNNAGGVYEAYLQDKALPAIYQDGIGYALKNSSQTTTYRTPKLYGSLSNIDDIKNAYEIDITYKPQNTEEFIEVLYRLDGKGDWQAIEGTNQNIPLSGMEDIKVHTLHMPPASAGQFIELSFIHSSQHNKFEIYCINLTYDVEINGK